MKKIDSPYSAITGCTFLYYEFKRVLPILMDENSSELLKKEIEENNLLQVNSLTSRKRFVGEFKKRFDTKAIGKSIEHMEDLTQYPWLFGMSGKIGAKEDKGQDYYMRF